MDTVILNSVWHIISVEKTAQPGILKLWIFNNHKNMFDIKLRVPRTIYINSYVNQEGPQLVKNKTLPRNRQIHNLYEMKVNEDKFEKDSHAFNQKYVLSDDVEGVYESMMPL